VEQLRNWQENFPDKEKFIQSLKVDFFKERIFVVTPDNEIIDLPRGATPVDFAYRIHSEIGDECVGAKVNKKIVPLDQELHSGEMVEIVTHKGKKPTEDWLRFVKTEQARGHIRSALRMKTRALRGRIATSYTEFKIANQDRPGYLKDVTAAFSELKINITYLQSQTDPRRTFSGVIVRSEVLTPPRIEKVLVKLKKIPGTREITFKFVE
jgi:(p)ppGpp synthase/HD superfamily hydrolase